MLVKDVNTIEIDRGCYIRIENGVRIEIDDDIRIHQKRFLLGVLNVLKVIQYHLILRLQRSKVLCAILRL